MLSPSITRVLLAQGGIARMAEFLAAGIDPELVRISCNYGRLLRIRKGWYCAPGVWADVIAAVRVGGRLACVSALAFHDGRPAPVELHVWLPSTAARPRHPDNHRKRLANDSGVVLHWAPRSVGERRAVVDRPAAVRQALTCRGRPPASL